MKIKELGVANFRSFNSDGVKVSLEKPINIFIGKNNSGKSNFLRFLKSLSKSNGNIKNFPIDNNEDKYQRTDQNISLILTADLQEIWGHLEYFKNTESVFELQIKIPSEILIIPDALNTLDKNVLLRMQNRFSGASSETLIEEISNIIMQEIKASLSFISKIVYISPFRQISESSVENNIYSGQNLIPELFKMMSLNIGEERKRERFNALESFIRELLNEKNLSVEIPHTQDKIIIDLNGNRLSLDSLGTGIHELIILCSAITINEDSVFCIEEPEIHLHPELQRRLLGFMVQTGNRYFITTHSNVFLENNDNVIINHVKHTGKYSIINPVDNSNGLYQILDDLGYKASDILQSNGIIWVEGPSDRIYINKWINLLDSSLKEGIHYSIMFYGGRLLSHLCAGYDDEAFINLLRINRNAIVVIDRDGKSISSKINNTKKRISAEIGEENCWITKGREIENYLSEQTIKAFLEKYTKLPKYVYNSDAKVGVKISEMNKKIRFNYEDNKVKYSKELVENISETDLEVLDLKAKIEHIVWEIGTWNRV